ncbi:DUF6497 family protein [Albidovulum sediminis]|uniref:DUF6497 family protein n=1 Tax=Albidovulum sediminis TaxID=3066345 RepID=A0ABT2NN97_9RHOB|nr:DUF6497 family protein [Defluviimonas sediminis]MCT8330381.1 DUF6497 family protein [Defluviimonas sediminis]
MTGETCRRVGRGWRQARMVLMWAAMAATVMTRSGSDARAEETLTLPSGMVVSYLDTIHSAPGPEGLTIRFRFVAADLALRPADEATLADMTWLCETYALPRLASTGPVPEQVIITLADRPVEFGTADPEATQYFEAFRPEGETCEWEVF